MQSAQVPAQGLDPLALGQRRAWVEVDLAALAHNVREIRGLLAPGTDLLAVVKADAYGHGAVAVAPTLLAAGATWLGVATVLEGIELRQAGITAPILLLGVVQEAGEIDAIATWQLQPTLVSPQQARWVNQALSRCPPAQPLPVHLNFDTGMSRLGHPWQDAIAFVQAVRQRPHLRIASLYSHLANADDPDPTPTEHQHQHFSQALDQLRAASLLPDCIHFANSAATLSFPHLHYTLVRPGLALYGLYPGAHQRGLLNLRPALQLKARITQIRPLAAGSGVSYGHRFVAPHPMTIAVVSIGYGDGVPRLLSNCLSVLVRGQRLRQLGAITMDQLILDVSDLPTAAVGDIVTLLGQDGPQTCGVDHWADAIGTISWEILCGLKSRLPRIYRPPTPAENLEKTS